MKYKKLNNLIKRLVFLFKRIHSFLTQFGINLLKIKNILYLPKFFFDLIKFKKLNGKIDYLFPTIADHLEKAGNIIPHYFYQDIIVASYIFKNKPIKHVDIGSRLDGFVSHIACFRKIEVFDIRSVKLNIKNIKFTKLNLNNINKKLENYTDSLSCLHTIEHLGLGRYGDEVNPQGFKKGFYNLVKMLKVNGVLYISFPISKKNKVFFNSERRFNPLDILSWSNKLQLERFDYIDDNENIYEDINLSHFNYGQLKNGCGIYTFKKIND